MKTINTGIRSFFMVVAVLVGLATPALALDSLSPYTQQPSCTYNDALVLDPSANGNARICLKQTDQLDCEKYNFCMWRDTTSQNTLADHTANEYPGLVYQVFSSITPTTLRVLVYQAAAGPAVTAIIGSTEWLLVGAGGGGESANAAKLAFQAFYPAILTKRLAGIVLPSVNDEDSWGVSYWRSAFYYNPQAQLIVNASYASARLKRDEVKNSYAERHDRANGGGFGTTDQPNPWGLTWGTDSFLGAGSMKVYRPNLQSFVPPTTTDLRISEESSFFWAGIQIRVIPTSDEDAGLLVYLPNQKIMIAGNLGTFLPDAGSIAEPNVPIEKWLQTLDVMRTASPDYLITGRGMYMAGAENISARLTAQYDALQYLHDRTLYWINLRLPLDDIVATVKLPTNLANSPYNAQLVSTVPGIVRTVYHDHVGWFDGDPANLESLSTVEQAMRLIDFGGGAGSVLNYINKCITEHTRSGAIQALKMASVLRTVQPSEEVDALYVQALRFLAWTTPSAHLRNYYLTEVLKVLYPSDFVQ